MQRRPPLTKSESDGGRCPSGQWSLTFHPRLAAGAAGEPKVTRRVHSSGVIDPDHLREAANSHGSTRLPSRDRRKSGIGFERDCARRRSRQGHIERGAPSRSRGVRPAWRPLAGSLSGSCVRGRSLAPSPAPRGGSFGSGSHRTVRGCAEPRGCGPDGSLAWRHVGRPDARLLRDRRLDAGPASGAELLGSLIPGAELPGPPPHPT